LSVGADLLRFSERPLLFSDGECQRVNLLGDNLPFQWSFTEAVRNQVVRNHDYYLRWPDYRMSVDAARITRFNPAWVANGDDPEFVLDAWESHARPDDPDGPLLLGHSWLGFDVYLWNLWRKHLGRPSLFPLSPVLRRRILDTNLIARAWKEGWKPPAPLGTDEFYAWQYRVLNGFRKGVKTNLTLMCKELKIVIDENRTHDGAYDLALNVQVNWALVNQVEVSVLA
jgi:hypothetical protein